MLSVKFIKKNNNNSQTPITYLSRQKSQFNALRFDNFNYFVLFAQNQVGQQKFKTKLIL